MRRFLFLIKLFKFDYKICNDIYFIYSKVPTISADFLCFKVGLFTKLLKLTSISANSCAMFPSENECDLWIGTNLKMR